MSCLNPIRIKNPRYIGVPADQLPEFSPILTASGEILPIDYWIDIPCGKCILCQRKRQQEWRIRLSHEFEQNHPALFITLTFNDDYLVKFIQDPGKAVSLFLDRLRKSDIKCRYFIIPELGDQTNRIHFHGILFGIDYIDQSLLNSLWKYGHTWIGYVNEKTISYVTKYVLKPTDQELKSSGIKKMPRIRCSKNLGIGYLTESRINLHHSSDLPVHLLSSSKPMPLPRYYFNKLFDRKDKDIITYKNSITPRKYVFMNHEYLDEHSYNQAVASYTIGLKNIKRHIKKQKHKSIIHDIYGDTFEL